MPGLKFERNLWRKGFRYVAGLDEAGRGALAGPIVAAAVIFSKSKVKNRWFRQIQDSKLLRPKIREKLSSEIKKNVLAWSVAKIGARTIDQKGINWANQEVIKRAVRKLRIKPEYLLIDGRINLKSLKIPYFSIVQADRKIFSCAAASILAKVYRDHLMINLDKKFPQYHFAQNKGYGTKEHYQQLRKYKPCPCHRRSFRLK
ncbi:MAG: ribonuclease HII [Patescibacteria group bacterium]|nr:ribonuclease HII [Patescibacteria group bacterium]